MTQILCRHADLVATLRALGLTPIDQGDCIAAATHLASGQLRRPGLVVTVAAHVCVWHAEQVRREPLPNFVPLPHTVLTGAHS